MIRKESELTGTWRRLALLALAVCAALNLSCGDKAEEGPAVPVGSDHLAVVIPDSGGIDLQGLTQATKDSLVQVLADEGRYLCCVKPGCEYCIKKFGRCECYVKKNDPICGQCYDGYKEGRGKFKLINLNELKKM